MPDVDLATPANDAVEWLLDHFGWLFDAIGSVATDVVGWIESALTWAPPLVVIVALTLIPIVLRR
jgi:ABC-type proline/glycine betaine transport system permease subunit